MRYSLDEWAMQPPKGERLSNSWTGLHMKG
jgi:hypothetical protein